MAHISPLIDDYGYPTRPNSQRRVRNILVGTSKRLLLGVMYGAMCIIGAFLRVRRIGNQPVALTPATFSPRRILILRVDLIGDLVLSLTVVRLLKRTYPHAEIDLLALPSSAKVVEQDPDLAHIIPYDPNVWRRPKALFSRQHWHAVKALRQRLQTRQYDLAISVFGPWAAILALLSGAPRRVGFSKESYPGFMTDSVPGEHWHPGDRLHEVDYCLQLAQAAGATISPADRVPRLYIPSETTHHLRTQLSQEGISLTKPLIACHVTSNNGQSKRWPLPYWSRLIDRLIREEGAEVVITGAPADLPVIERILQRCHEQQVYNLAGKTSLTQLAALLQQADLLLTGDSGPMHIAAATGTPLIAIHGPTDPAMSGPVSPLATVLRSNIWCSPCYTARGGPADCRFFTTQCMKDITPEQVLTVIRQKLQEGQHRTLYEETDHSMPISDK